MSSRSLAATIEGGFDHADAPAAAAIRNTTTADLPAPPPPPSAAVDAGFERRINFVGAQPSPPATTPAVPRSTVATSRPVDTTAPTADPARVTSTSISPPSETTPEPAASVASPKTESTMADRLVAAATAWQERFEQRPALIATGPARQPGRPGSELARPDDPDRSPTVSSDPDPSAEPSIAATPRPDGARRRIDSESPMANVEPEDRAVAEPATVAARMTTPPPATPGKAPRPQQPVSIPAPPQPPSVVIGGIEIITPSGRAGRSDPLSPLARRRREGRGRARRSRG